MKGKIKNKEGKSKKTGKRRK